MGRGATEKLSEGFSNSMSADRRHLRRAGRAKRRGLSYGEQQAHARSACRIVLRSGLLLAHHRFSAYFAADGELDPEPLVARIHQMQREVAFPVINKPDKQRTMRFQRLRPGQALALGPLGIWQPAATSRFAIPGWSLSMMLVPLVAFDTRGTRLGMGGGYYDAYLAKLGKRQPFLLGYAHECQRVENIPRAPWDVPLDAVATETSIYFISKRAKRFIRVYNRRA